MLYVTKRRRKKGVEFNNRLILMDKTVRSGNSARFLSIMAKDISSKRKIEILKWYCNG
jgi:hypothetical protein